MKEFDYVTNDGIKTCMAEPIKIAGRDCFIFSDIDIHTWDEIWNVSDCETGMRICVRKTKQQAVIAAETNARTQPEVFEQGRTMVKNLGYKLPINKTARTSNRKRNLKSKPKSKVTGQ